MKSSGTRRCLRDWLEKWSELTMTNAQILGVLEENWALLGQSKNPNLAAAARLLAQHVENPRSYVTLAGETSSGKSTLINSFLGKRLLPAGARPTTGTVTCIEHGLVEKTRLLAVNRDATVEELSAEQFQSLSEKPDGKLLRLKVEVPAVRQGFEGLTVFDTPGFNAIISEHAEVLKEFLPESDVVVFPVSYKVGFGSCDQQLMSLVGDVGERFGAIPVILVVNRVPANTTESDKRVQEILLHAEDTLHQKVKLVLVPSAAPTPDGESVLPQTTRLWNAVYGIAFSEERAAALNVRFQAMTRSLLEQRLNEINGELAAAEIGRDSVSDLEAVRVELQKKEEASYKIVDRYMSRIESELPRLLAHAVCDLKSRIEDEIADSNKWTDVHQCSAYVEKHVLPFGTSGAVKEIETYLTGVFEKMDDELSEMANQVIHHLNDRAQTIQNPQVEKMLANLSLRLGEQLAGNLTSKLVQGFGGVGGSAAGVGNLVKMGVKKAGALVGKTFGRQVYVNIGKIFTKRMVQTMSLCLQAVVEFAFFAWEANRWQGELTEKMCEIVDKWEAEVRSEFLTKAIPEYRDSNYENVKASYAAMRRELDTQIDFVRRDYDTAERHQLEVDGAALEKAIVCLEK